MKRLITLLSLVIFAQVGFGQLSGTRTIPTDANYPTIKAAIDSLNAYTVTGSGITFYVNAEHTETISSPLSLTATGTSATPIIFQKSGDGNRPKITAYTGGTATPTSAVQDGIWNLVGSDYVTIDGIELYDPNTSGTAMMEYGFSFFKAAVDNGCQNNTIKNCVVTLSRENYATGTAPAFEGSKAIQVMNSTVILQVTGLTPTTAGGANSYNKFYGNTLQNCNYGIALSGFAAVTPFSLGDTGNDIGGAVVSEGNTIINYGGGTGTTNSSAAIRANNQWGINISWNTINNNNGFGVNHPNTLRGIFAQAGTSANATISNNTVTINGGGTTQSIYGIDNGIGSTPASNTVNISNNFVTGSYSTATTAAFYGIQNTGTPATLNVTYNTVSNVTTPGTGGLYGMVLGGSSATTQVFNINNNNITSLTKTGIGLIYGIQHSTAIITNQNNTIDGLTINAASASTNIYGIYDGGSAAVEKYLNNIIRNISSTSTGTVVGVYISTASGNKKIQSNQLYNFSISAAGTIYGIRMAFGSTDTIADNLVHELSITGSASGTIYGIAATAGTTNRIYNNSVYSLSCAGGTAGAIYGIHVTTGTNHIYKNSVYNFSSGSSNPTLYGINLSAGTANNLFNNFISDLRTPAANAGIPLAGINIGGGTAANVYYNTVYLNAQSTGALFGSAALNASTTPTLDMRNNVLVNISTPMGTGVTAAFRRSTTTLTTYSNNSNNNCFWAGGTENTNNAIFYDGTTTYTMEAFQALVTPRDAASFRLLPDFMNVTTTPYDLHINTGDPSQCESGGSNVASITDDYDSDIRHGNADYSGSGTAPDVGADEFAGTANYTCTTPDPGNTQSTANNICLGQSITLSLQNATSGTGVSYQWKSSANGTDYINITGATSSTYTTTPSASLYYKCAVTCQVGPVTVESIPLQITFSNSITGTTPGSRCGTGTVDLAATCSGGTLSWYATASGGASLGTGSPFTTPTISTTTTYYVGAEVTSSGNFTIGAGVSTSTGSESPFYYLWGGHKSQFLIKASELSTVGLSSGNLTALSFDIVASTGMTFQGFNLSIGHTALTALTSTLQTGLTTVYSTTAPAGVTPTNGIFTITFSTPFFWDGSSNIIVETCWSNNNSGSSSNSATVKYDVTGFVSNAYRRIDNQTPPVFCGSTVGSGTMSSRPKMILAGQSSCSSPRTAVIATVTPAPVLTITANQTICNNTVADLAVTSTADDYNSYIWSPVTDLFSDELCTTPYPGTIALTVYFKSSTAGTTTYTCSATNSSGCADVKTSAVTNLPASTTITANPSSFCQTGASTLTAVPATGYTGATLQWQNSTNNVDFSDIAGANSSSYTTPTLTVTTYYKLLIKIGAILCYESNVATAFVNNPDIISTIPGNRCGIGTVTLGATGTGGTLNWYAAATGGPVIGTGSPWETPEISATTAFYVADEYGSAALDIVTIGTGTNISSVNAQTPFGTYYEDGKHQYLVLGSELAGTGLLAGNITSIALNLSSVGSPAMTNFAISMKQSSTVTELTTTYETGLTTVFSNPSYTPAGTGWQTLTLSPPFAWDGVSNLIVQICYGSNSGWSTNSNIYYSTTTTNTHHYGYQDNGTGCAMTSTTYFGADGNRANMRFGGLVGSNYCASAREAVEATVTPGPDMTVTENQTVCYSTVATLAVTTDHENFVTYIWSPITGLYTDILCTTPYTGTSATMVYFKSATVGTANYSCKATNATCVIIETTSVTNLPASTNITATPAGICVSGTVVLSGVPVTGYGNATLQWQSSINNADFSDISGANSITYTTPILTSTSYYKLVVKVGATVCYESNVVTVVVTNPTMVSAPDGERCGIGTVDLEATGSTGSTLKWFNALTNGFILGTGSPYTTPIISSNTNYYVAAFEGVPNNGSVGPVDNTIGAGATGVYDYYLKFDVLAPVMTLEGVYVYPAEAGNVILYIRNSAGTDSITITYPVTTPNVKTYIPIGFSLTAGTNYRIGHHTESGGVAMYRNSAGASYPYTLPGVVSITGSSYTSTAYYYYCYDWVVSTTCHSAFEEVSALITPPPVLSVALSQTICNNFPALINVTSDIASYDSYIWSPLTDLYTNEGCTDPYTGTSATTLYFKSSASGTFTYECLATYSLTECANIATTDLTNLPASTAISADPESHCLSGSSNLTAIPATGYGAATFQWLESDNLSGPYTIIDGANALTYTTPALSATKYYKLQIKLGAIVCNETDAVTVYVASPRITASEPGTRCGEGTVSLEATGTGGTLKWYAASTGGSPIGTSSPWITPVINTTTNFYVAEEFIATGAGTITLGTGTSTTATSGLTPYSSYYEGSREQYLIRASELTALGLYAGNLTSLAFNVTASGAGTYPQLNFTIKLAQTANTEITGAYGTPTGGFTTVFFNASEPAPAIGWRTYTFTTPFNWDGSSNILVDICHDNDPTASCPSCYSTNSTVTYTATTFNSCFGSYADNAQSCGVTASSPLYLTYYTYRPNMQLGGTAAVICASDRQEVTATVTVPPTLSITSDQTICTNEITNMTIDEGLLEYSIFTWSPVTGLYSDGACLFPYVALENLSTVYVKIPATGTTIYTCRGSNTDPAGCVNTTTSEITVIVIPAAPTTTGYSMCTGAAIPEGEGLQSTVVGGLLNTGSQTINFDVTAQPFETNAAPGNIVASATMDPIPAGSTITSIVITYNGITALGTSWRSDVQLGLSGAILNAAAGAPGAPGSAGFFNYIRTATTGITVNPEGGEVNLLYWDVVNDNTAGDEATFPLGGQAASVVINYTTPDPAAISWYTAETGGLFLANGSPFNPIGVDPSLPNSNTPETYTYYAEVNNGTCFSPRTSCDLVIGSIPTTTTVADPATPVCAGTSVTLTANPTSGIPPYLYSWKIGGTEVSTLQTFNVTPAITTTYDLTVTDVCTTTATASVTVTVYPVPTASAAYNTPVCSGETLNLDGTTDIGTSYSWRGPNGFSSTSLDPSIPDVTTAASGTYTFTSTLDACSSVSATVEVVVNPTPSAVTVLPATSDIPEGNVQQLIASGGNLSGIPVLSDGFEVFPTPNFVASGGAITPSSNSAYFMNGNKSVRIAYLGTAVTTTSSTTNSYELQNNIDLTGYTGAQLTFAHICATEGSFDYGYVAYSTDGGATWISFPTSSYTGTGTLKNSVVSFDKTSYEDWNAQFTSNTTTPGTGPATSLWKTETINIPAAALASAQFRIRFQITTDGSVAYYGWLIDDVRISGSGGSSITWLPTTGLFTDANGTIAYMGAPTNTVYAKPEYGTHTFTATAATTAGCIASGDAIVNVIICPPPNGPSAIDVTSNSANLTWASPGSSWEYVCGVAPLPVPTGSGTPTTSNSNNPITGLLQSTTYQYYVRSICNPVYSNWSIAGEFNTPCAIISTFPWTEGFGEIWPPICWADIETQSHGWDRSAGGSAHTGTNWAYCNLANSELVTPEITLTENSRLIFWYKPEDPDNPQTLFININGTTVDQINDANSLTYEMFEIPLSNYTGEAISISFVGMSGSGGTSPGICLDDVVVTTYTNTWTGNVSTAWDNPGNWDATVIPGLSDRVIIPSTPTLNRFPVIDGNFTGQCYDIIVMPGASVTVKDGSTLNVAHP